MACHEVAALRLGLMRILGIEDEAERAHELAELGGAAREAGPIRALAEANDFARLKQFFEAALVRLQEKVAHTADGDPQLPYYRSLMLLTKKVELDLRNHTDALVRFYRDLEEMHDFVHEIYPAG
jgi:hypothetical protein